MNENNYLFERDKISIFQNWWFDINKSIFFIIIFFIIFNMIMTATSSISIANKIDVEKFFFIKKQAIFLILSLISLIFISSLNEKSLKILAISAFICCIIFLFLVLIIGTEIKGSKRWVSIFIFTIQPVEFTKIFFILANSYILSYFRDYRKYIYSLPIYLLIVLLLIKQPDFGSVIIFTIIYITQIFLSGIRLFFIYIFGFCLIIFVYLSYNNLPHVQNRIDNFFNKNLENYQVAQSLKAYKNGSLFGKGINNGEVKKYIPDAHTDFIFPVIIEEFGSIFALFILILYFILINRIILFAISNQENYKSLFLGGFATLFSFQILANIAVTIGIIPTKGITLPFISYGGSSILSFSIAFGYILSITRKKYLNY